jgi:hypothetical protein
MRNSFAVRIPAFSYGAVWPLADQSDVTTRCCAMDYAPLKRIPTTHGASTCGDMHAHHIGAPCHNQHPNSKAVKQCFARRIRRLQNISSRSSAPTFGNLDARHQSCVWIHNIHSAQLLASLSQVARDHSPARHPTATPGLNTTQLVATLSPLLHPSTTGTAHIPG